MTKTTRTMNEADFTRVLNERMRENPLWLDLFKAISKVMTDYVHENSTKLSRIRAAQHIHRGDFISTPLGRGKIAYIKHTGDDGGMVDEVEVEVPGVGAVTIPLRSVQNRNVLINGSKSLGFDFFSDSISDEDYSRIYRYVGHYWQHSGTETFVQFMGFIKNMRLELETLWTRDRGDYANSDDPELRQHLFLEPFNANEMIPVWEGAELEVGESPPAGRDYPTSHVQINYDLTISDAPNITDLVNLFYFLAPIHLVLQRINASVEVEFPTYKAVSGQLHIYDQGYLALDESFNGNIDFTNSTTIAASEAIMTELLEGKDY